MNVLTESDFDVLERLLEHKISPQCKKFLIKVYGKGGQRQKEIEATKDKDNCLKNCFYCTRCSPYLQRDLAYFVLKDIKNFKSCSRDI